MPTRPGEDVDRLTAPRTAPQAETAGAAAAHHIRVRGIVQGVGFRPFVYREALARGLAGWVLNGADGVEIHVEGPPAALGAFLGRLTADPPPAARISHVEVDAAEVCGLDGFEIRESARGDLPTTRISPDLPVCARCLAEMADGSSRRTRYPYINCTECGPRYSIVQSLPYDRARTTMQGWAMCRDCAREYADPADRRFHAQPIACPRCGPTYSLIAGRRRLAEQDKAIRAAARLLAAGQILAVKGIGGYHLACNARNPGAIRALRERKFRKEKPFALMVRDLDTARELVDLSPGGEALLTGTGRPILLARARQQLPVVAPDNEELGVMLPYAPLHHLLFEAGAPDVIVLTSANRSSEPIAYRDEDARAQLDGIADAFLIGERPIARRIDDSVVRASVLGSVVLRHARGFAPRVAALIPSTAPILAVGADLKSAITLVIDGQAVVSQHIGDLEHFEARVAFQETIRDLTAMYAVDRAGLVIAHDLHPGYVSTAEAQTLGASRLVAVQHHRAHIASVMAEHGALDQRVLGVAFDGTGYGDDGSIWGGELFVGSVAEGFERVGSLRPAVLPGGDAAARFPVQAAAGFLHQLDGLPDLAAAPFHFPERFELGRRLIDRQMRTFPTTSAGRLFDTAAALLGFTRAITFEGQAAIWLEQLARRATSGDVWPFPFDGHELDFRPLLQAVIDARRRGIDLPVIARAFHRGVAAGLWQAIDTLCAAQGVDTVALSGGVFQNELLLSELATLARGRVPRLWINQRVPPNDGGIALGQAALAAALLRV